MRVAVIELVTERYELMFGNQVIGFPSAHFRMNQAKVTQVMAGRSASSPIRGPRRSIRLFQRWSSVMTLTIAAWKKFVGMWTAVGSCFSVKSGVYIYHGTLLNECLRVVTCCLLRLRYDARQTNKPIISSTTSELSQFMDLVCLHWLNAMLWQDDRVHRKSLIPPSGTPGELSEVVRQCTSRPRTTGERCFPLTGNLQYEFKDAYLSVLSHGHAYQSFIPRRFWNFVLVLRGHHQAI